MSYEPTIHETQTLILRHLLFVPDAGFAELQKRTGLTSDHFNFHIKKLVEVGYVQKQDASYSLTPRGKEYANRMDTDENEIEKQPKVSVVLLVERQNGDRREFLTQQRLKQPWYGFYGRAGGKVRWGESFEEAAARELAEETGLQGTFTFSHVFHKRDYKQSDSSLLEDKIFVIMHCNETTGTMMEEFEGGKNFWMTQEELVAQDHYFESARDFVTYHDQGIPYHAQNYTYDTTEY
ncbi:MAG TPA: MarR family winged helix-turn-helix transcriptional regulator [Candidatus Saccharibacteria bacterium]|nr:MarR family winged helix-turn-helix transcriptional regulator [Candidatus Saccharibacteria bacterium]